MGGSAPAEKPPPPTIPSQDLVASLPAPLIRLLLVFAQPISGLRAILEVLCWKSGRRIESWMLVGGWWGVCLGSRYVFKYLTPALLFIPLLPLSKLSLRKRAKTHDASSPSSQQTLLLTLSDLHSINSLLPPSPIPSLSDPYSRFTLLGPRRLLRGLIVIWSSWLILGRLIGFSSLLALIGTVILLIPSPTFAHLIHLLSRSLAIRRMAALVFLMVFGTPADQTVSVGSYFSPIGWAKKKWAVSRRPSLAFSFRPKVKSSTTVSDRAIVDDDDIDKERDQSPPIYFRFEVHENQRWWMGLDWTSALLPQERPSWCDSHLLPVSPPASFSLPPSSSMILPSTDGGGGSIKRTAVWEWYDDDWSIVRAGAAAGQATMSPPQVSTATVPPPAPMEDSESGSHGAGEKRRSFSGMGTSPSNSTLDESMAGRAHSIAEQAFTKGLERLKARTTSPTNAPASPKAGTASTASMGGLGGLASPGRTSGEFQRGRKGSQASEDLKESEAQVQVQSNPVPMETIAEKDDATDNDGWVYGDNKWENMGPKGGLGRFTRRRRWQRRAILTETVQYLSADSTNEPLSVNLKSAPAVPVMSDKKNASAEVIKAKVLAEAPSPIPEELEFESDSDDVNGSPSTAKRSVSKGFEVPHGQATEGLGGSTTTATAGTRDDVLRMRLKKAMGNMGA